MEVYQPVRIDIFRIPSKLAQALALGSSVGLDRPAYFVNTVLAKLIVYSIKEQFFYLKKVTQLSVQKMGGETGAITGL